jgi:RNA polymerase subunit RPABC4/transcription elongation factor Spt4
MFCLKCGKSTGSDSEFCQDHAEALYTEQSVQDDLEKPHPKAEFKRCPGCNEEILADETQCPSCQLDLTTKKENITSI